MRTIHDIVRAAAMAVCAALALLCVGCPEDEDAAPPNKAAPAAAASSDEATVTGCDGTPGVKVPASATGKELADAIMDQWLRGHPGSDWVAEEKERHELKPPADNSALLGDGQGSGHTYGRVTQADLLTWARETEKFVVDGSRIFHNAQLLGSTVSVSCDMCHPHAANTHPETYPKFQAQLGRAVLLRDMINWCIENPVRGPRLAADDPRMRALEAYIMAQRSGTAMSYGKH